jgi:hypothetical protein
MGTRPPPAFAQATLDVVADPLGEAKAAAASASSSVASIGSRLRPTAALIEAATMDSTAQPSAADVAELLRTGKQGAAAGTQRPRALKKRSAGSICACTRSCTLAARDRASRGSCACACACACACRSVCLSGWLGWLAGWLPACLSVLRGVAGQLAARRRWTRTRSWSCCARAWGTRPWRSSSRRSTWRCSSRARATPWCGVRCVLLGGRFD